MTLQKKVYVANGAFLGSVIRMFKGQGWQVVAKPEEADFLCLTGGNDVHPQMYGERVLQACWPDAKQDAIDKALIDKFKDKPKLGICRGGQILNVVNGGKMWQDVNNHNREHLAMDVRTKKTYMLSSIHHQMMIPAEESNVEVLAVSSESTERNAFATAMVMKGGSKFDNDIEALWYPDDQALCFQPHPEVGPKECTQYFFDLIDEKFPEIAGQKTNYAAGDTSPWADLENAC